MSPGQPLPSFNSALNPDQCKTVLPNLSYPHRPITHVPWTGSSRPLRFSVSRTVFFLRVLPQPYLFFLRKQRVRTWQSLLVFLPPRLVYILFPRFNSVTDVNRVNPSGTCTCHCKYMLRYIFFSPNCFSWGRNVHLGECWLESFTRFSSDSPRFLVAQDFDGRWESQTKTFWRIEPQIHLSPPVFGFEFAFLLSIQAWFWFWCLFSCLVDIFCFNLTNL